MAGALYSAEGMVLAVVSGFALGALAPWLKRLLGDATGPALALLPAALFAYFMGFIEEVAAGKTALLAMPWVPSFGIDLSFRIDGLSLLFALLISGIGAFIVLYAGAYLHGAAHQGRFFSFLLMFMASMLGLVLAENAIVLFVFWELTSLTSFLLIGYDHDRALARRAALQALLITGGGGLVLLAGIVTLGAAEGSFSISRWLTQETLIAASPLGVAAMICVLIGAFTKSAQVPFHIWLPNAMEAPTPVSAYLHSATMVKAGVYLIARLNPAFDSIPLWEDALMLFGGATFLTGAVLALKQSDLKLMLAQTTVASLGLLILLIGIGSPAAIEAAMLYLFAHALFKAALFLVAGNIDHGAGLRDVRRLGLLGWHMPLTALAAALAGLSLAGLPPAFGFIAKEAIYRAGLSPSEGGVLSVLIAGSIAMVTVAAIIALRPFWMRVEEAGPGAIAHAHEAGWAQLAGPLVLAFLGLLFGIVPGVAGDALLGPAIASVSGDEAHLHLALFHGIDEALMLSGATIGAGLIGFAVWPILRKMLEALGRALPGPDQGYDHFFAGLMAVCADVAQLFQSGRMTHYMRWTFVAFALAVLVPLLSSGLPAFPSFPRLHFYEAGLLIGMAAGALLAVTARTRLLSILALGITGYSIAIIFLIFGAPDLAFTQVMIETLSVVFLALILTRLPLLREHRRHWRAILRDGIIAISAGFGFTCVMLMVLWRPFDAALSTYFNAASYVAAHGRNVVNVIIVDFRGFDTLGEITVVMVCATAAVALISLRAKGERP